MARCSMYRIGVLLVLISGCAKSPAATSTEPTTPSTATASAGSQTDDALIRVEVTHNRVDGGTATIYVQPAGGVRSTLGTISAGETKVFSYRVESANRVITLSALNSSGQSLTAREITVPRGAGVAWNLESNTVRTQRRD